MNLQQAQKLLELYEDPDILIQFIGSYVDGLAAVYKDEVTGDIVFDSEVYRGATVMSWDVDSVIVSRIIKNWMG